jgi:hypothetical protein
MKKILALSLLLAMVLSFTGTAFATPSDFIGGTVASIDKKAYDNFDGPEISANNSAMNFDNFSFISDNKTLNAWYIDVAEDISGELEVAYKISNNYFIVTFDVDGPGKYWIADSKGSNGATSAKIGEFTEAGAIPNLPLYLGAGFHWRPFLTKTYYVGDQVDYTVSDEYTDPGFYFLEYEDTDGKFVQAHPFCDDIFFDPVQGTILTELGIIRVRVTYKGIAFSKDIDAYCASLIKDEHLMESLQEAELSLEDYIVEYLLWNLDDDGYLFLENIIIVNEVVEEPD